MNTHSLPKPHIYFHPEWQRWVYRSDESMPFYPWHALAVKFTKEIAKLNSKQRSDTRA